jgi:hypothetical protein
VISFCVVLVSVGIRRLLGDRDPASADGGSAEEMDTSAEG